MSKSSPSIYAVPVPRTQSGSRADQIVSAYLQSLSSRESPDRVTASWSRTRVQDLFRQGLVRVRGEPVAAADRLATGMVLEVWLPEGEEEERRVSFTGPRPEVLLETEDFVALCKPAGLTMHPFPGMREQATLADYVRTAYPETEGVGEHPQRPGMVHRLDRDTTGVIVIAKHQRAYMSLKALFQGHALHKTYLALVYGVPAEAEGDITLPLVRQSGSPRRRVVTDARPAGGHTERFAHTRYRVLGSWPKASLLVLWPQTGRTHQLRVHLEALGHPILGDQLYGSRASRGAYPGFARQLLHAWRLEFSLSGASYRLEAPVPPDFTSALASLASGSAAEAPAELDDLLRPLA